MKMFRLALPIAALAALMVVDLASANDNPVREFLNQQFHAAAAQADDAGEKTKVADSNNAAEEKNHENPWAGLTIPASVAAKSAPVTNAGPILALVDKHAAAHGIPAGFARAVVRIESNFNPRATGRQQEVGLMQIKYETARGIGFTGTREELYDPNTNLKWGMKYLAMAWKLGGATPCGAVLRYQAGHMATQPTAASRAYCAKVTAHMASAN